MNNGYSSGAGKRRPVNGGLAFVWLLCACALSLQAGAADTAAGETAAAKSGVVTVDAADTDAAQPETAKADAAKADTAKADAATAGAGKREAAKSSGVKADVAKADTAATDTAKPETAKADVAKADAAKPDATKSDSADNAHSDTEKADTGKADAANTAAAKPEAIKADTAKPEPAKTDSSRTGAGKAQSAHTDTEKADAAAVETVKADAAPADSAKADTAKADGADNGAADADAATPDTATTAEQAKKTLQTGAVGIGALELGDVEIGSIVRLDGRADARNDNKQLRQLATTQLVQVKDVIRTKSDGVLELAMTDGSHITLAPDSRLQIAHYQTEGKAQALLILTRGRMQLKVTSLFKGDSAFVVETPEARIPISGAELEISVGYQKTTIFVIDGDMQVTSAEGAYDAIVLYAGEGAVVRPGTGPLPVNHLSGQQGADALRIYADIGSGGPADLASAGIQNDDPASVMPTIPSALPPANIPNAP